MESIHDISKGFLTYDDRQNINTHQCSVDVIELYRNHIDVHLNASKERLLKEYQKRYELEEMPTARVTRPHATDTSSVPPNAPPAASETFRERNCRLFDKKAAAAALRDNTTMAVAIRPATREQPPHPDTCIYATLYIKLKTTLEVIFVLGWGEFILQYQFNKLDDRISKLEKGQNITKTTEETAVELYGEMSMDTELIGKFITQQVAVALAEKAKQYEKKIKKFEKGGGDRVSGESTTKNGTRGGGRASKKKKTSQTQPKTKSRPP